MTSIIQRLRNWKRGIAKDAPLDYSAITENLYIAAWPEKHHLETIKSLDVRLIISTILESSDKELGQDPLSLVRVRSMDLGSRLIFPTGQILKGVDSTLPVLQAGEGVMVFCKAGMHRSATMKSCILVGMGYPTEEAMTMVEQARSKADLKPSICQRIKSFEEVWLERQSVSGSQ